MKLLHVLALAATLTLVAQGCKKANETTATQQVEQTTPAPAIGIDVVGFYVSKDYGEREKGSDWVSVTVDTVAQKQLQIEVRSRSDIKKPTCTFDGVASAKNDSTYVVGKDGKNILFVFAEGRVTIAAEKEEDSDALHFYCSGGATLAGNYAKVTAPANETK